jgi:hypothetical protein
VEHLWCAADCIERARDVSRVRNVAFDQLDAVLRQHGRHGPARRRIEVLEDDDALAAIDQPTEQDGANVPRAGQQRRHRRAF